MALIPKFNMSDVEGYMKQSQGVIEQAIINRLKFVGEKFVINARNNHTYTDRTGALTSSIGFQVLKDGVVVIENFTGGNTGGKAKGLQVAIDASEKFPHGIVLIVVAGMEYAAAVESRNYDVLTASSITAEADLLKGLQELKTKLGK